MKILCVEDGSVDLDNLPSRKEWRDDKVLVYRKGSIPPYVLEITEESRVKDILLELKEISARIQHEQNRFKYGSARYDVLETILVYVNRRIENIEKQLTHQHEDKGETNGDR